MTAWTEDVGGMIRQWTLSSALTHLRTFVAGLNSDQTTQDRIQSWLVTTEQGQQRRQQRQQRLSSATQTNVTTSQPQPAAQDNEPMEVSDTPNVLAEIPPENQESVFPPSLLSVPVIAPAADGAAADLAGIPSSWIPIISRDQSAPVPRSNPYSDAYLSGQPSKRRKLNADSKPHGDMTRMLQQSLQEAVDQTGLQPALGATAVADQVAANTAVQDSLENMIRDTVQVHFIFLLKEK